jgi:hypothetical protein
MTKKFIILIILLALGFKLSAQQVSKPDSSPAFTGQFNMNKVVLEVYKIDSAQVNGIDQTDRYRKASAAIIFYTQSNYHDALMTVIMPGEDSESWGEIQEVTERKKPIMKSLANRIITQFIWSFTNTIDGLSWTAVVRFTKESKDNITFRTYNILGSNGIRCKFITRQLRAITKEN